jgi:hypothetical protein
MPPSLLLKRVMLVKALRILFMSMSAGYRSGILCFI